MASEIKLRAPLDPTDKAVAQQQDKILRGALRSIKHVRASAPTGFTGVIHKILDAQWGIGALSRIREQTEGIQKEAVHKAVEARITIEANRRGIDELGRFFDSAPDSQFPVMRPNQQPSPTDLNYARNLVFTTSSALFLGTPGYEESRPMFDSASPIPQKSGLAVVAGLQALGFSYDDFRKNLTRREDGSTFTFAQIFPWEQTICAEAGRESRYPYAGERSLLATYEHNGVDARVTLTARIEAPQPTERPDLGVMH